ncbi:Protein aurora borealis N-terminus family protein [Brugia pahangi]
MNITDDSDTDVYDRPKFNSTVLRLDERSYIREESENTRQNALKLSPILKDQVQFIGSNCSLLSEQQRFPNSEECSELQDSDTKVKKIKLREDALPSFIESNSKFSEAGKENIEITALESNILSERSIRLKNNSTARSHITNPFDSDMGSLSATTYSPSLFNNSKRNIECETPEKSFRWSIGQMADFHPAVIDEAESMCQTPDPVEDAQMNKAIDKFWASQKYVLPSPYFMKGSAKSEQDCSPSMIRRSRALMLESPLARPVQSGRSVEVQTMFTFPPNLDLIGLLGKCFQYEEGEVPIFEANLSLNTLRRKLFIDALSSEINTENEDESSIAMTADDNYNDQEPFGHERPAWYHPNDEIISTRKVSFDGIINPNQEGEINNRLLSPDISPIKN